MIDDSVFYFMGILLGISLGLIGSVGIDRFDSNSDYNQIKKAIEVCESNLPRYQHCEIKGVVKE